MPSNFSQVPSIQHSLVSELSLFSPKIKGRPVSLSRIIFGKYLTRISFDKLPKIISNFFCLYPVASREAFLISQKGPRRRISGLDRYF
jgi:hypothetical protein